ncbi:insulin gene enhancer protein ISL-1 [Caerostris extrusa]|uniref:Insulin gene enhancer protein ISL-1 n=1 Tax=Caerostris extrusa TaxID=172846 RepID=A0AAV4YA86_CAEEX|nr:insulin gene enhancer protein ISL-1 [Caerostris extrusa]
MRARNKIYHIECFRCVTCTRQLLPGDEYALRDDGLFCKADNDCTPIVEKKITPNGHTANGQHSPHNGTTPNGTSLQMAANAESMQTNRNRDSVRPAVHKQSSDHKPTRVRTVLNEEAAAHVAHFAMLPTPTRRPHEGTVGGNDGTQSACDQGVVSEQEVQRQKKNLMMKQLQQQGKSEYAFKLLTQLI